MWMISSPLLTSAGAPLLSTVVFGTLLELGLVACRICGLCNIMAGFLKLEIEVRGTAEQVLRACVDCPLLR